MNSLKKSELYNKAMRTMTDAIKLQCCCFCTDH